MKLNTIHTGQALEVLRTFPDNSVHCIVTSPPYWALRDYGIDGQLGLEKTPEEFIEKMVAVFMECHRVLRKDGTVWLNIGDSYAHSTTQKDSFRRDRKGAGDGVVGHHGHGMKTKDLVGIPWMLAFALRQAGYYLRQDIIWHKPNPMPESISDRCTKSHEYIFLLSKSPKYFYDAAAIFQSASPNTHARLSQRVQEQIGSARVPGKSNGNMKAVRRKLAEAGSGTKNNTSFDAAMSIMPDTVNKRSVWTIPTASYKEAHFATFPEDLIVDCIKAGTSEYGCCTDCGSPYTRKIEPTARYKKVLGQGYHDHSDDIGKGMAQNRGKNIQNKMRDAGMNSPEYETVGWEKSCKCETAEIKPAVVLDPFSGAGTTPLVACKLHRDFLAIELNPAYVQIAEKRLKKELGMFYK